MSQTLKQKTSINSQASASKGKEDEKSKTMPMPKEKQDGGVKLLYGNFKHLYIRKSGPGFRMDRMDKHPDPKVRKNFKDGQVTIEVQKEVMLMIEKKLEKERAE